MCGLVVVQRPQASRSLGSSLTDCDLFLGFGHVTVTKKWQVGMYGMAGYGRLLYWTWNWFVVILVIYLGLL